MTVQESFDFYLEAQNSAGQVQSPKGTFIPDEQAIEEFSPLGPLTFSQFIGLIIAALTVFVILLLLFFIVPGAIRRRQMRQLKDQGDLSSAFFLEIDRVVRSIQAIIIV